MRSRVERSALLLRAVIGLAAAGCTRDFTEHEAYRRVRYAQGDGRYIAAREYMHRFPHGAHASEVGRIAPSDDDAFWMRHHTRLADLTEYLAEYPEGAHAEEARFAIVTMYGGRVPADQFATLRPTIDASLRPHAPDLVAEHWLRLVRAATSWNEPLNAFYAANPPLLRQFDETPVPRCEPGACTKTVDLGCAFTHLDASGEVMHTPFHVRMLSYGARIVGFDLFVSQRGAWLWNACTSDRPIESLPQTADENAVAIVDRLEWAVRALERNAMPTPTALRPREIDRLGANAMLPSSRGRYFWSLLVGCEDEARGCMRIDGYQSSTDDEVGIRALAIPASLVSAAQDRHAFDAPVSAVATTPVQPSRVSAGAPEQLAPIVVTETAASRGDSTPAGYETPAAAAVQESPATDTGREEAPAVATAQPTEVLSPRERPPDRNNRQRGPRDPILRTMTAFAVLGGLPRGGLDIAAFALLGSGQGTGALLFLPIVGPISTSFVNPHSPWPVHLGLWSIAAIEATTLTLSLVALSRRHPRRGGHHALVLPTPVDRGFGITFGTTF